MASGYLLKLKLEKAGDVKGESEVEGYKEWLEIDSFAWGTVNPGRLGRHEGTESTAQDFNCTMTTCTASPVLMQACAMGDPIKEFKLALVKAVSGQKPMEYMSWKISEAFISSYQLGGSSGVPTDSFSINFKKIETEFKEQAKGGKPEKPFKGSFDYGTQKPA
jgi:type VI secretion system secreted protein Hcp